MEANAQRLRLYMYQVAQALVVHDDFTIVAGEEQEGPEQPLLLIRRKWNTLQVVRLVPSSGHNLEQIEGLIARELPMLQATKQNNAVQNCYSLTVYMFAQWRSDENMRAISELARYEGMVGGIGAGAMAVDLARGVLGPLPSGSAAKDIDLRAFQEPLDLLAGDVPEHLLLRSDEQWFAYLQELSQRKQAHIQQKVTTNKKPLVTYWLLGLTILIYLIGSSYPEVIMAGVMFPPSIRVGEYWRLFTPMFLHVELMHIAFNMMALYSFGRIVEGIFGLGRYLILYLVSGVTGCLLSFMLNDNPALGASGAIFGLFGALLAFGRVDRRTFSMTIGASIYGLLAVNLAIGFLIPGIDYWGHIGGLIGGFFVALALGVPKYPAHTGRRVLASGAVLAFSALTFWWGMTNAF